MIILNFAYIIFYAHYRPEVGTRRKQFIEIFNEFTLVICSYNLMFYTYFVLNLEMQFTLGYSFVLTVCAILGVNVINLVYAVGCKKLSQNRKNKSQKTYEKRFHEYAKI